MRRRLIIPAALALAVAPLFAGCVPTDDDADAELAAAVVAVSPEIEGALVGYSSSGASRVLSVKAYIPTAESLSPEELAAIVDAGFEAVWLGSPSEPAIVYFGVVPTAKPDDAKFSQQDVARFPETGKLLGTDSGFPDGTFGFVSGSLEFRYGARQ